MESEARTPAGRLGTFAGVFTPSILTILGIILFLRLGYVVGSAGLFRALVIIAVANVISLLTSISLSAVATNIRVKGGGDYYLISRTLGVGFGGAIGLVLFLAQAVSIAFYCIGFGEAASVMVPHGAWLSPRIFALVAVTFLFVFAWLGADWATRFQYIVMVLLAAALASFYIGAFARFSPAVLASGWRVSGGGDFWVIFAIFFPAVTGFTQGVSMSGDLEDPGKSLPRGTFMAVGLSAVVYFTVAILFAGALPLGELAADYGAMKRIAAVGPLVDAGVIAATLSSAMASFLGAPRILQSLAGDRIFPLLGPFAMGAGPSRNPRRAVLLSAGIAYLAIALGNLNLIAPVVSMFFLISYGLLNYATYFEARSFTPSFRPRFRLFDYRLSFLGALSCLGVMLAIDLKTGIVAVAILFGIYQYVRRTAGRSRWADSQRSFSLQQIREHLLSVSEEPEHPRDWRPHILAFSDDPQRRARLLKFASWIEGRSGLTTVVQLVEGGGVAIRKTQQEAETHLREDVRAQGLRAFSRAVVTPDPDTGLQVLLQAFGVGPLRANTLLLNWLGPTGKDGEGFRELRLGGYLRAAFRLGCNIVLLNATADQWTALAQCRIEGCRIDVWWFQDRTSRLMLLLAYLATQNTDWAGASIRVLASSEGGSIEDRRREMEQILDDVRIAAGIEIVDAIDSAAISANSSDAALVMLPFRFRANQITTPFRQGSVEGVLAGLPAAALVIAAEDIDLEAEPEEGAAGEIAAAEDVLTAARKRLAEAEKEAERAQSALEKMEQAGGAADESEAAGKETTRIDGAKKELAELSRKVAKATSKVVEAERDLAALGVSSPAAPDEPPGEKDPS
ncbi:MAG: amino acid permease [Desulfobacterales bacterium]